jgi:hypothetical protein
LVQVPRIGLLLAALCCTLGALPADAAQAPQTAAALDDFESDPMAWRFVGGEEFPGAKGSLARDTAVAHAGGASLRLEADFSGGGAYVGVWREAMPDLGNANLSEIRLWVRSEKVTTFGVRIVDQSDQCHQSKGPTMEADGKWHEVALRLSDLVGGEHWGGANDGKWHGPAKGLGFNVGKDSMAGGTAGTLWIDDITCVTTSEQLGHPTVLAAKVAPPTCRPGFGTRVTYRWDGEPMGRDFTVFVHVVGPDGGTIAQDDHTPPQTTAVWSGRVEYTHLVVLPTTAPEGEYRIVVGLYDRAAAERGWDHQHLRAGEGVKMVEDDTSCDIGGFRVDGSAPLPELPAPTLDLTGCRRTFSEEFDGPLDVSAWGPGTRWISHTPYSGDFGDARFGDPGPDSPFTVEDGILRIEARKGENGWRAGLLSSADPKGEGFSQQYGYFEMRAKFPQGPGTWPAFWLLGIEQLKDRSRTQIEIDVVEQYGVNPYALHTTVHLWYPDGKHWAEGEPALVTGMTEGFHTYGVLVGEEETVFYYDGSELRRTKTPEEAKVPLYLLVNLALGGGWPIDATPNPSVMEVDYVRAYARGG